MEQNPQGPQDARDDSATPSVAEIVNSAARAQHTGDIYIAVHHHHHHHTTRPRSPVRVRTDQVPFEQAQAFREFQTRRMEEVRLESFIRDVDLELVQGASTVLTPWTWNRIPQGPGQAPSQLLRRTVGPSSSRYADDDLTSEGEIRARSAEAATASSDSDEGAAGGLPSHPLGPRIGEQGMVSDAMSGARITIKNLLIITALRVRLVWNGVSVDAAWDALVAKFVRDGVFQNDREVQDAFRFAFNQSPRDAFEPLIRGEVEATHAAWRAQ